jgi:hypothetical protein
VFDPETASYVGLAKQFPKDAFRQTVYIEAIDGAVPHPQVLLGALTDAERADPGLITVEAMGQHLATLCDGDVRWRFQTSQIVNQTLPNAVLKGLQHSEGLQIDGRTVTMLGTAQESFFGLRRRSRNLVEISHTSTWRPYHRSGDDDAALTHPFFVDAQGEVHSFKGALTQVVRVRLKRPQEPAAPPRLGRITVDLQGRIEVIDAQSA